MRKFINSFRFAHAGLSYLLRTQRNARLHFVAAILVIAAGLFLKVTRSDWAWLIIAITQVMAAEAFNSALEMLADRITTASDEKIRCAKDVAAAAVLIASIGSAGIGVVILGPYCLPMNGRFQ